MENSGTTRTTLHPRGATLGGFGFALLIAGLWRIDGVLASLGLAAWCLLGLSMLAGRANLAQLRATMEAPEKTVAGTVFPMKMSLLNGRRLLDAFGVTLEIELPAKTRVGGKSSWIAAGSGSDTELRVTLPERAAVDFHTVRLRSEFPLGLFQTQRNFEIRHQLMVFPRPASPRGLRAAGILMDAAPLEGASAGDASGEPRGLRPWRHGDPSRKIHWPASIRAYASGMPPLVREADPPGFHPRSCVVLFHSFGTDGSLIRPDRFERAISLTAGTLRHLHSLGIPAAFMADFDDWQEHPATTRSQLTACQEILARAKRTGGTEAHNLQSVATRIGHDQSLIVISDMPVSAWTHALPKRMLAPVTLEPSRPDRRRKP